MRTVLRVGEAVVQIMRRQRVAKDQEVLGARPREMLGGRRRQFPAAGTDALEQRRPPRDVVAQEPGRLAAVQRNTDAQRGAPAALLEALEQIEAGAAVRAQRGAHTVRGDRAHQLFEPRVQRRLPAQQVERADPGCLQTIEHPGERGGIDIREGGQGAVEAETTGQIAAQRRVELDVVRRSGAEGHGRPPDARKHHPLHAKTAPADVSLEGITPK